MHALCCRASSKYRRDEPTFDIFRLVTSNTQHWMEDVKTFSTNLRAPNTRRNGIQNRRKSQKATPWCKFEQEAVQPNTATKATGGGTSDSPPITPSKLKTSLKQIRKG